MLTMGVNARDDRGLLDRARRGIVRSISQALKAEAGGRRGSTSLPMTLCVTVTVTFTIKRLSDKLDGGYDSFAARI
jgi:hypothetical protein